MAAFDALLHLLIAQGAESLTLADGAVPELSKGGECMQLSMPPLAAETLARFHDDLRAAGDEHHYILEGKGVRAEFEVTVEGRHRIAFRLAATRTREASQDAGPGSRSDDAHSPSRRGEFGELRPAAAVASRSAPAAESAHARAYSGDRTELLDRLIQRALETEATDLFLSSGTDARLKIDRRVEPVASSACDERAILDYFSLEEDEHARLEAGRSVDLAREVPGGRIRANLFRHRGGVAAAIRPIRRVRSLVELGLPAELSALTRCADGLVVMVGPAGSGKSSTLAALIAQLAQARACHIVTIEDPIEFEHEHGRSMIHQREVGTHVESFAEGLWAALRESPDVILLGEMRDPATMAAALTAAETGHLVLSTLHSGGAAMAIDRIIDSFPPHQQGQVRLQLSTVLRAVVTQVLLPGTAAGRLVPAIEKMVVTHAIAHAIREGRGHQLASQIQTGREEGMVSLELSLADLVRRRAVTSDTALAAARDPGLLRKLLGT